MSSVKLVEFRQDRRLIDPNFDGYKLSLDTIPTIKHELTTPPLRAKPSEEQYSFLHVELFSLHNHLVQDPWDRLSVYFINAQGSIQKCTYCLETGRPKPPTVVYKLPSTTNRQQGDYNISFKFMSEQLCLLCDGCNLIYLLETGDRRKSAEWKVAFKSDISQDHRNFVIRDAKVHNEGEIRKINFVLHRIGHREGEGNFTELLWYTITESQTKVRTLKYKETFCGKGSINYCALEPRSTGIILCSNKSFKAVSVAQEAEKEEGSTTNGEETPFADSSNQNFAWSQTDEDITIKFACRPDVTKNDYKVTCTKDKLQVKCRENVLLNNSLFSKVDTDLTTWTLENDFLQLTLVKDVSTLHWPFLVSGGPPESTDAEKDCSPPVGPPISNLEAQMEECDEPTQSTEEEFYIDRIDQNTLKPTHRILLGSRPPLFLTCLRPGFPPAIATRQDVDACLWLLHISPTNPENWTFRHEGTFNALGYVEASKQQKKFIDCSPDLNYAMICESFRHIFIYKSKYDTANMLRNRNGPQVSIGKQQLVTLEDAGEVLGMALEDSIAFILTEKFVLYLQINVD